MIVHLWIASALAGSISGLIYGALFLIQKRSASFRFSLFATVARMLLLFCFWYILLYFFHIDLILTVVFFLPAFWFIILYYRKHPYGRLSDF